MNTILIILTGLAIQTSTFDGVPYVVTDTMFCTQQEGIGCYSEENGIEVKTNNENKGVLFHELAHDKFNYTTIGTNANYNNAYKFWTDRPFNATNTLYYKLYEKDMPWESMARWYTYFLEGNNIPKDMIEWFMYSEKDYSKHKEEYQKLKMKIVWKIKK